VELDLGCPGGNPADEVVAHRAHFGSQCRRCLARLIAQSLNLPAQIRDPLGELLEKLHFQLQNFRRARSEKASAFTAPRDVRWRKPYRNA
jgi:hypothetical protein